jgi:hypothetical protein
VIAGEIMRTMHLVGLALVLIGLPACAGNKTTPVGADLQGKLSTALAVSDTAERDITLAKLAHDAALAGETSVVRTALDKISDSPSRDVAAQDVALVLLDAGMPVEAKEVAGLIQDQPMREAVLAALAKG